MRLLISFAVLVIICISQIETHGMMLNSPSRSSRWRFDLSAPTNWNDNELFCGGLYTMIGNGGRCGLCGDNFATPQPRPNEIGGQYGGSGVITRTIWNANSINVGVQLTTNHLGYFAFNLCNLDAYDHESEDCFNRYRLRFPNGSDRLYIGNTTGEFDVTVMLPAAFHCSHCVLRWTYVGGNNWGECGNGTSGLGCGPQETFKNCADIAINTGKNFITAVLSAEAFDLQQEQVQVEEQDVAIVKDRELKFISQAVASAEAA